MDTASEYSGPGCVTACSIGHPLCETSDAPISDQWPDWWTSSLRDSRVSPIASPEPGLERLTTATSGRTRSEPLGRWDRDGRCWKTCQASLLTGTAEPWPGSWPRSGMTVVGRLYPLRTLEHHTGATGGGAWRIEQGYVPTPTASNRPNRANTRPRKSLVDLAQNGERMWPTPAARDAKDSGTEPSQWARHTPGLSIQVQRQWPTPQSRDHRSGEPERMNRPQQNLYDAAAMWPTPTVNGNRNRAEYPTAGGDGLETAVKRWRTTQAGDHKISGNPDRIDHPTRQEMLADQVANWPTPRASQTGGADRHGEMPEAFRGGKLNPRWVEWLQGIPIGWTETDELPQTNYTAWQTLSAMQDDLLPETETKREMGRDVQAPTLLRFQLCGICTWPEHARGRPETSAADDPANQLPMREYIQPSKTPHRRESSEQLGRQSGGALPEMSHGCPHEHRDMGSWWEVEPAIPRVIGGHPNRVNQVRTLGNGIVPAVVARFLRELMS